LLPVRQRRRRYPGRIPDRLVLTGILHVLHIGIAWKDLPQGGVWDSLHQRLLCKLNAAGASTGRARQLTGLQFLQRRRDYIAHALPWCRP
jgi:hypothetical protein